MAFEQPELPVFFIPIDNAKMYYFTILTGASQRPLRQFFEPQYAYQLETIPGIKDLIAKFR